MTTGKGEATTSFRAVIHCRVLSFSLDIPGIGQFRTLGFELELACNGG